ncbi:hypothetical protein BASA60_008756 [Batrachochytrium salamandrivorans]|nr:hypothetical protein BASA60_008756 [Batrachochytrium salamandrivorans]
MLQPSPSQQSYLKSTRHSVDTTLASGLEARSYQPGLNSYKDSPTLISLERRDDSEGSSKEIVDLTHPLRLTRLLTILRDRLEKIVDLTHPLHLTRLLTILRDCQKKIVNLTHLVHLTRLLKMESASPLSGAIIIAFIKSNLGEDEYFKIKPHLPNIAQGLEDESDAGYTAINDTTSRILEDNGSVTENFQNINRSFRRTFDSRWELLGVLRLQLNRFKAGNTLEVQLNGVAASLYRFYIEQQKLYKEIMEKLKAAFPQ